MKYFTKFLCLFLGAAMMLTMAACGSKSDTDANAGADGEKKQLVVATSPDFPPFEFLDGSQIVGIEPALMQAIADKLGMELVWEQVDFDSIIPGIQAERYDVGAAGITITPDRQKNCDFSNPYFLANQVIVVNPGSDIQGKADLAGKTIAVQTGTTAEEYCMDNGYSVLSFASNNDAQAALTSGKADAWVVDNEAAARMAADQSLTVLDEAMTLCLCLRQGQQPGGPGEHRPSGAASGRHRGEAFPGVRHRVRVSPELMSIFQQTGQFFARWLAQLEATFIEKQRYLLLVDGLKNTLVITLCALVIGVTIGALVAMIKYCGQGSRLLRPLCWLCDVYTTVIRGIPVVVQLLIFYFLILKSSDGLVVGIVTFGINSGAYVAELMRSGIAAVDPGQMEAGRSLGLSRLQAAWHIVLPQAMKNILPAIGNEMIALLKETAVAGYVAVQDLTRAGNLIRNNTYDAFNPLLLVAVVYLLLVIGMTQLLGLLERRLRRSDQR